MANGRERPGSKRRFGEQGGQGSWLGGLAVASRDVEKVYRFESVLATGGQGTVRVVQHIKHNRLYACKTIFKRANDASFRERLRRVCVAA